MAACNYCNTMILFGGRTEGTLRFCNDACFEKGYLAQNAARIPRDVVEAAIDEVHQGECPKCNGDGPVDIHVSHTVWSAVYLTSWNSKPQMCCRSCGRRSQLGGLVFSLFLGWWGFPWGLIMTPVQIIRNLSGMFGGPPADRPSDQLENIIRLDLAERMEQGYELPGQSTKKLAVAKEAGPIKVTCNACDTSLKAPATAAGKTLKCPKCSEPIQVPDLADDLVDFNDLVDDGEDVPASRGARSRMNCRYCDEKIPASTRTCEYCGEDVRR